MKQGAFFCHIDSKSMCDLINQAKVAVVYAGPGIRNEVASAMVNASLKLGSEMITVNLDVDDAAIRMGYGDIVAIRSLERSSIAVGHTPGLRTGLLLVDEMGYSFTPTPLYLEAENNNESSYNAIQLTPAQVKEAQARLSPVAKSIAVAQSQDSVEKEHLASVELDVISDPVTGEHLNAVEARLKAAPPAQFDLARQVRVYESYFQYVELKLSGAAVQRKRLSIPKELQELGASEEDIQGRLRTTFELVEKDGPLSSKHLDKELKRIRDDFTGVLGKDKGRVLLKSSKKDFDIMVDEFQIKLNEHSQKVKQELQESLDLSKQAICNHYFPIVKENPPAALKAKSLFPLDEATIRSWINRHLTNVFPSAADIASSMKLDVSYKDVTFETLNNEEFLASIESAFPDTNWKETHAEFLAAAERSDDEKNLGEEEQKDEEGDPEC
jgi:hypothetical protein